MKLRRIALWFIASACFTACLATGADGGCGAPWPTKQSCDCAAKAEDSKEPIGGGYKSTALPETGGEVRVRIFTEPSTLLSILDPNPEIRAIADHNIFESLVRLDPSSNEPVPEIAEGWSIADDEKSYTFTLRTDTMWHDGEPLTSADVLFTFERLLDPDEPIAVRKPFEGIRHILASGPDEVTFEFGDAPHLFLRALSLVPILPVHVFRHRNLSNHPAARTPIGSGPMRFSRWDIGHSITLERNPNWRGQPSNLDRIIYRIAPDNRIASNLFTRKELDIVPGLDPRSPGLLSEGRVLAFRLPRFEAWAFNTNRSIFSRTSARQAIAHAIDRDAIRCALLSCRAETIEGPWDEIFNLKATKAPGSSPPKLTFDLEMARTLLAEDGWMDRDDDGIVERGGIPFSFTLMLPDVGRDLRRTATVVQGDLAIIGIEMRIATQSWATFLNALEKRRFDATVISVDNRISFDSIDLLHSSTSEKGGNITGHTDSETDALLEALDLATSEQEKHTLRQKLTLRLAESRPMVFTHRPHEPVFVRNGIHDLGWSGDGPITTTMWRSSKHEEETP